MKKQSHFCIDRTIPFDLKPKAAELAIKENPANGPKIRHLPGVSSNVLKIALETGKLWKNGRTLNVAFLDGSATQRQKTIEKATMWCKYANIKFNFNGKSKSEIRISFNADPGSWSAVGTDSLVTEYFSINEPTMNFGWLTDDTNDIEWRRVVVHEFGHALGAIHEHQNPKSGIKWNLPAVYKYFSGPPNNWPKDQIDYNIVNKYTVDQINGTKFDIKSIMLYSFPPEMILSGKGTPENTDLSANDKKFIKKMYPLEKK
jgi:prepilin-type processing-associated H-X9-DG protein